MVAVPAGTLARRNSPAESVKVSSVVPSTLIRTNSRYSPVFGLKTRPSTRPVAVSVRELLVAAVTEPRPMTNNDKAVADARRIVAHSRVNVSEDISGVGERMPSEDHSGQRNGERRVWQC